MAGGLMRERLGLFIGFENGPHLSQGRVLVPYSEQRMPLRGTLLVVAFGDLHGRESVQVGRVVGATGLGDLLTTEGEEYLNDLLRLRHPVPDDVKSGRLRYAVGLRLLGQVSRDAQSGALAYTPSIRQLPHVGAEVGFPSDELTKFIACGCVRAGEAPGPEIGHLAVGDFVMDGGAGARGRTVPVHFRMDSLVGRRTAVFARAGMGKSNFTKVLLSRLYQTLGKGSGNAGGQAPPGTLVIDPEGEYAFRNASEPGLLDVPGLEGRIAVFTDRREIDAPYRGAVRGSTRIDFGALDPVQVVNNLLPEEKQNLVFANMLRSLKPAQWQALVRLLERDRYGVSYKEVATTIGRKSSGESFDVVSAAMVNNLMPAIDRLHESGSTLAAEVESGLRAGRIVVLDVSMRSGDDARLLVGLILQRIFANNVAVYTAPSRCTTAASSPIACLAVLEEAQFYLGGDRLREDSPFVRWFKEGRKFGLGSIVVTQQPGAIGAELISQCDNFFVFHLLNSADIEALSRANPNYAGDIAQTIAQEPIPGNCYLWSSRGLSLVTCARVAHFGRIVEEAESDRRGPERVKFQPSPPAAAVTLGVRELKPPGDAPRRYLMHAVRRAIDGAERVFVFTATIAGEEDGRHGALESVVASFVMGPLREVIAEDRRAGRVPDGLTGAPATPGELAEAISGLEETIAAPLLVQEDRTDREHLVFRVGVLAPGRGRAGCARLRRPG